MRELRGGEGATRRRRRTRAGSLQGRAVLAAVAVIALAGEALGAAGDLDPTFGVGGIAFSDVEGSDGPSALALQQDGKILVLGGTSRPGVGLSAMVTRFAMDGAVDRSFGSDGVVEFDLGQIVSMSSIAIQPDARIVLGGSASITSYNDVVLARLERDGSFDSTFGDLGIAVADLGDAIDTVLKVVLQPDGKVLAIGSTRPLEPPFSPQALAVTRFLPSGALDSSFGGIGWTAASLGDFTIGVDGDVLADGRILVGGHVLLDGHYQRLLLRYQPDGTIDPSFGLGGVLTWQEVGSEGFRGLSTGPGGGFTALGTSPLLPANPTFLLLTRHLADGGFDPAFGSAGSVRLEMQPDEAVLALAEAPDGKLVVLGRAAVSGRAAFLVLRFLADGSPDPTFGAGGRTVTAFPEHAYPVAIVVQPDGKIVAAGSTGATSRDTVLVRYEGASPECGDGRIDGDEHCDDGIANGGPGSCCDESCRVQPAGVVCRPARSAECDVAELCSGSFASCPADGTVPAEVACIDDGDACTSDRCDGSGLCAHDARPDTDADGVCDLADACTNPGGARSFLPWPRPLVQLDPLLVDGAGRKRSSVVKSLQPPLEESQRLRVGPYRVIFRHAGDHVRCVFAERRGLVYEVFSEMMERRSRSKRRPPSQRPAYRR